MSSVLTPLAATARDAAQLSGPKAVVGRSPPVLALLRARPTDQGTPGMLMRSDGSRLCYTMELPWRANARRVSSIPPSSPPPGRYLCRARWSPHFGRVYEVTGVPGRTNVLLHTGNWAGDIEKGYRSHVLGCIALGLHRGVLNGQLAVMVSRPALSRLLDEMHGEPFILEIRAWES